MIYIFVFLFFGTCVVIPSSFIWNFSSIFLSQLSWNEKFISLFLTSTDALWFNSYLWKTRVILRLVYRFCLIIEVLLSIICLTRIKISSISISSISISSNVRTLTLTIELRRSSQVFGLLTSHVYDFRLLAFFVSDISCCLLIILCC